MSTLVINTLVEKSLVMGINSTGYARNKILVPNVVTQPPDSIASVTVNTAGTGYTGIPTVGFTGGGGSGAIAAARMKALTVAVVVGGVGYTTGNTITFTGGTFSAAAVATAATFQLIAIAVNAGGNGYNVGDQITLAGGTASSNPQRALLLVETVSAPGGAVTGVSLFSGNSYTATATTFTQAATTGGGTGATFNGGSFSVLTATITTPGSYSVLPSNPVAQGSTSGSGTGFTGNLTYGVNTVVVTNGGEDYATVPTVTFTGGAGSGASATAVLASVGDAVTVSLQFTQPLRTANYSVSALPGQACVVSAANKTINGCDITLTPLSGGTLAGNLMDVVLEFTA